MGPCRKKGETEDIFRKWGEMFRNNVFYVMLVLGIGAFVESFFTPTLIKWGIENVHI